MLACELYQINKDANGNNPKTELPIKKIFYENNKIIIDGKNCEEYGSKLKYKTIQLQKWLEMPLNTIDSQKLNLPDYRTGSASPNPYIEIYGILKTNQALETKLILSMGKKSKDVEKSNYIEHVLDLTDGKVKTTSYGKVTLKIDRKNYFVKSDTLFSKYVNTELINETGNLDAKKYDEIIQKFLEWANKQVSKITKSGSLPFRIYILPTNSEIKCNQPQNDDSVGEFTDYCGNSVTNYASTPTKLAKFLTYDDQAFTINCKIKKDFYKNLGMGDKTQEKVYVDASKIFKIAGLEWAFIRMENPNHNFTDTRKGILFQLYNNYQNLETGSGKTASAQTKIICIKKNNAKQEIIIDENITMDRMKKMFSNIKSNPPFLCLEIFIDKSSQNPVWDRYLYVVKHFLAGNNISKDYILSYFDFVLKQKRYDWVKLKTKIEQKEFFTKADFCMQYLINTSASNCNMDRNEVYAEKIGQIVKLYIEFKQTGKETDNSLSDILTYAKYDREKLRFVMSRISRGIQLSKIDDTSKKNITKNIGEKKLDEEIDDVNATKDYSYFFFKGYYANEVTTA